MNAGDLYVTVMPDGSEWGIPVKIIAESKAHYYARVDGVSFEESLEETYRVFSEFEYEITDWAQNNMDWEEVRSSAILLRAAPEVDYQQGWINGEHFLTEAPEVIRV